MIQIRLFADAVMGKSGPGGVGIVLLSEKEDDPLYYEHKHPIPEKMTQTEAELFGILSGLESLECALASHKLAAKDVFLHVYTDCRPALYAIHNAYEQKRKPIRILCKRIIRIITTRYNEPNGGGAAWHFLSAKRQKVTQHQKRLHPHMARAHELSRAAKASFRGLL